jgi:hypothetical protein
MKAMGVCTYLRTDFEQPVVPKQDTASSCSHCVDIQLGALNSHTSCCRLKDVFKLASVPRYVGGGSSHVKANNGRASVIGGSSISDDAT